MTLKTRLAALAAGLTLAAASLLSAAPAHAAGEASIEADLMIAGEIGYFYLAGCEDPTQVSGIVVDVKQDGEIIAETKPLAPSVTEVNFSTDEAGEYSVTMTCLPYSGEGVWASATIDFVVLPSIDDLPRPDGKLPVCTGVPVTFSGLTGAPGERVYAALVSEDGKDLQQWWPAGTVDADGKAVLTLTLKSSVPAGSHLLVSVGEQTLTIGAWIVPVGDAKSCTKTVTAPKPPAKNQPGLPSTGA